MSKTTVSEVFTCDCGHPAHGEERCRVVEGYDQPYRCHCQVTRNPQWVREDTFPRGVPHESVNVLRRDRPVETDK